MYETAIQPVTQHSFITNWISTLHYCTYFIGSFFKSVTLFINNPSIRTWKGRKVMVIRGWMAAYFYLLKEPPRFQTDIQNHVLPSRAGIRECLLHEVEIHTQSMNRQHQYAHTSTGLSPKTRTTTVSLTTSGVMTGWNPCRHHTHTHTHVQ